MCHREGQRQKINVSWRPCIWSKMDHRGMMIVFPLTTNEPPMVKRETTYNDEVLLRTASKADCCEPREFVPLAREHAV